MSGESDIKKQALAAISDHLETVGPQDWGNIRGRFSQVSDATWWRWVKSVKSGPTPSRGSPKKVAKKVLAALPSMPSPDYLAKGGEAAQDNLDFLKEFNTLYEDAKKLRDFSMGQDGKAIRTARFFSQSINLRNELLQTALKTMGEVWELRRVHEFHQIIIQEIANADMAVAQRIVERLRETSKKYGMSMSAMDMKV